MNTNRIASAIFACLLVTAGVAGPMSQTASAYDFGDPGTCEGLDYAIFVVSNGLVTSDDCKLQYSDNTEMQTHLDHYQQGETLSSSNDGFLTAYQNFGQDTTSLAFSKAKIEIVNGLNDGNTSSVVKGEANVTVRDYYAQKQAEILRQYDRSIRTMEYSYNTNASFITMDSGSFSHNGFATLDIQLVNGSTISVRTFTISSGNYASPVDASEVVGTSNSTADISSGHAGGDFPLYYTAPTTDYSLVQGVHTSNWNSRFYDMETQSSQVTANVGAYVDGVYAEYQQGELNMTDVADPQTLASQAATDYNSSGYYSYAATNLAALGYAGDMGSSFHVTTANNSYNGTLFYTADDVTQFDTGTTYQLSNLNGTVYMAVQRDDGSGSIVQVKEDFTVESITDTGTGESMTNTTVESYTYDSTNTSQLADEIQRLSDLRQEYEDMNSGGGGGSGSGMSNNLLLVLLAGAAGAAILMGRNNGGGRNGGRP